VRLSVLLSGAAILGFCCWSDLSVAQSGAALHLPAQTAWGFDLTGMDRSVVPGDDFYSYANGAWNRGTEIPGDREAVGSLPDLRGYTANSRVRDLLEQEHAQATSSGTFTQKAISLYHAFMDAQAVEKLGDRPLRADLQHLNQINSKDELAASMGRSFRGFGRSLFNLDISYDDKDPKHYAVHLGQGGLGLPSRDYYLEPQFAAAKQAYEAYVGEQAFLMRRRRRTRLRSSKRESPRRAGLMRKSAIQSKLITLKTLPRLRSRAQTFLGAASSLEPVSARSLTS